ncbi:hypothetical protein SAY86_031952 [Trapa natans]|uniref:Transcription repressor n=1 Tax=Trapa natans TaxID=22666 RepID=A0AAN7R407_TRANT|nr:hypothetical protein SAY86_031952 [Trapa natans]
MEDSPRQKPRILPGMFRLSFASCSSRSHSNIVDKSILLSNRNSSFNRFPSMCRRSTPTVLEPNPTTPRFESGPLSIQKVLDGPSSPASFTLKDVLKGRAACPTSPTVSPPNYPFRKLGKKKKHHKREAAVAAVKDQWFSSEEEREEEDESTDTVFSSKSMSSSDSSRSHQQRMAHHRQRRSRQSSSEMGILSMEDEPKDGTSNDNNNMRGSFAVVKKSSDPYGDFRRSMVEMIIEKQMFGANDLERLLQCFLSLNSHHHHKVIVEVFTEIWEALFPHWS